MLVDSAGRIWLATQRAGLFRCDNPNDASPLFRQYTVAEGLSTDYVSSVVEDAAGYIYAGTARGVDRIDPRAPIGSKHIRHFTATDGLPESEQNTALRDRHGHLWFGTLAGLAEIDPGKMCIRDSFKVPQYIRFVDSFPQTVTKKVQKFLMREQEIRERGLEELARQVTA